MLMFYKSWIYLCCMVYLLKPVIMLYILQWTKEKSKFLMNGHIYKYLSYLEEYQNGKYGVTKLNLQLNN